MTKRKVALISLAEDKKTMDILFSMTKRALNDQRFNDSLPPLPTLTILE
jgi:hypothetical protein